MNNSYVETNYKTKDLSTFEVMVLRNYSIVGSFIVTKSDK